MVCRKEEEEGEMQKMDGVFMLVLPKEGSGNGVVNFRYERGGSGFPIINYHFASIECGEVRRNETFHCVIGARGDKVTRRIGGVGQGSYSGGSGRSELRR